MTKQEIMEALNRLFQNTNRYIGNSVEQYKEEITTRMREIKSMPTYFFLCVILMLDYFMDFLKQFCGVFVTRVCGSKVLGEARLFRWDVAPLLCDWLLDCTRVHLRLCADLLWQISLWEQFEPLFLDFVNYKLLEFFLNEKFILLARRHTLPLGKAWAPV